MILFGCQRARSALTIWPGGRKIREPFLILGPIQPEPCGGGSRAAFYLEKTNMTTKEIAEAVGKAEKTVRTWAFKAAAKSAEAAAKSAEATPTHPADWSIEEACAIIEIGLGKNAASLFRENARRSAPSPEDRISRLEGLVERLILALIPAASTGKQLAIPAAPLATRDELRSIVAKAGQASGDFRGAWGTLYQEMYYRLHRNVRECAKNRGMDTLDYVEEEGLLPDAVAIAREVFK